jgi:hypothetical protein
MGCQEAGHLSAEDHHEYRGYRVLVRRFGSGWRTTIYAPGSRQPMLGPQSDDPTGHDEVLANAKHLIDALMTS